MAGPRALRVDKLVIPMDRLNLPAILGVHLGTRSADPNFRGWLTGQKFSHILKAKDYSPIVSLFLNRWQFS
jgi:hypothetical protein